MKKLISVLMLAFLAGCTSMPKATETASAAPKLAAGTCAKLNPANLESWQESNPDLVFYIAEVGKRHYKIVIVLAGRPVGGSTALIKDADEDLIATECPQPATEDTQQPLPEPSTGEQNNEPSKQGQ